MLGDTVDKIRTGSHDANGNPRLVSPHHQLPAPATLVQQHKVAEVAATLASAGATHNFLAPPQPYLIPGLGRPVSVKNVQVVGRGSTPARLAPCPGLQEPMSGRGSASCFTLVEFDPAALCGSELGSTSITNLLYCCDSTRESSSSCEQGDLGACSFHCGSASLHTCKFASLAAGRKQPWPPFRCTRSEPGAPESRDVNQGAGWGRLAAATGGRFFKRQARCPSGPAAEWRDSESSSDTPDANSGAHVSGNQSPAASVEVIEDVNGNVRGGSSNSSRSSRSSSNRCAGQAQQEQAQAASRVGATPAAAEGLACAGNVGEARESIGRKSEVAAACSSNRGSAQGSGAGLRTLGSPSEPAMQRPMQGRALPVVGGISATTVMHHAPSELFSTPPTASAGHNAAPVARGSPRAFAWKGLFTGCLGRPASPIGAH